MAKHMSRDVPGQQGRDGRGRQEGQDAPRNDVDEALEETFPASDAPANTPETGIRIDPADVEPPDATTEEKKREER